jgi:monoamine oxidase
MNVCVDNNVNLSPKIVVIGGGLAGLTAAYRLQNKGMNVYLYEARRRLGGRVLSAFTQGRSIELGGQNICDGGEAKHLLQLIHEFKLELNETKIALTHAYFDGKQVIPMNHLFGRQNFESEALQAKLIELSHNSQTMQQVLDRLFEKSDPLYHVLATRLAAYEGGSIDQLSSIYVTTLYHMLLGGIAAAHPAAEETESCVNLLSLKKGNSELAEKLGEQLGGRIQLNMPLKQVIKKNKGYELVFQNGQMINTDILILACPCSVYNQIIFEENVIPQKKLDIIRHIQYGMNAKLIIPFMENPNTTGCVNDRLGSFFQPASQTLTLYYIGEASRFSKETISETYFKDRLMIENVFKTASPPFIAPQLAKDENFCKYSGPVGYSWPNDPYARGTYSYICAGQEKVLTDISQSLGEKVKSIFQPIYERLFFAGEHASILQDVPGTMEAACESGERTARMVLKTMGFYR